MDKNRRWTGIIVIFLGIAGVSIFATGLFSDLNNSSGFAISIFLIFCGLFVYLNPSIGRLTADSSWIDKLFWILVGITIITMVVIFEPSRSRTKINGIVIGVFLITIGVYQLIEPRKQ